MCMVYILVNSALCLVWCLILCLGMFVWQSSMRSCWFQEDRLRVGPTNPLGVFAICLARCLGIAPLGAVTMVGGSSDPSVPWSPGVSLQEKAGRPMGPSTLRCEFPWEVVVVFVGYLFWLFRFFCLFFVKSLLFLRGRCFFSGPLSPSRPDPYLAYICPSHFFFLSGLFVDAVCSLSLSLSQALGNPKPFWFGVPLVFLHPGHAPRHRSVHRPLHLPPGHAPAPVFFFFRRRSRWVVGGVWFPGWGLGSVGVLVWCFGRSWLLFFVLLRSCISSCIRTTAMPVFRPQWRLTPFLPLIGSSWVTRLLLGVDPGTVRSAAGRGCRRHCDPTQLLGTTIIIMTALPGHRRPPPQQTPAISSVPGFVGGLLFFVCHVTLRCRLHFLHLSLALDRQPYCHTLSWASGQFFSPFSKGEMLSVFVIWFFSGLAGRLLSFFSVLLILGSFCEKIFGSELLFSGFGVGRVFFGAVLPMFLLNYLVFRSRKCLEKILLWSGPLFE